MTWLSPQERVVRRRRRVLWLGACAALVVVATLLDRPAYRLLLAPETEIKDWYKLLRVVGYFPTWILIGLAVDLGRARPARGGRRGLSDGTLLALGAGLAGGAAEVLKLIVGRERPGADGEYVFRGVFAGFVDGSGLGMPSSHAAVAFGGAFMLAWLRPGTLPVALGAAGGCALTRLLGGDHFLSDVTVGALLAYAVARAVAHGAGVLAPGAWRYG